MGETVDHGREQDGRGQHRPDQDATRQVTDLGLSLGRVVVDAGRTRFLASGGGDRQGVFGVSIAAG